MEEIVLIGFGGHAKSVADCIERSGKFCIVGYTDIEEQNSKYNYLGDDENFQTIFDSGIKNAVIGIGYLGKNNVRNVIYKKLKSIGFNLPVIIDPSAIVSETVQLGEGTFIGKGAIINTEAKIGKCCIINTKALVEHECCVADFSHIAVGAVLCGQVIVGKNAFIGANSTVIQNRNINDYEIVPAGYTKR